MDLFDIVGPEMIGPSSSHTAGAARIGKVVSALLSEKCVAAELLLYGSFLKTGLGHGTDRALVGGLLGMDVDDVRIRQSLEIAEAEGLKITFGEASLRNAHPNSVVIEAIGLSGKKITVRCSSIGGGNILIDEVDGLLLGLSGENDTLVIMHRDTTGVIADITGALKAAHINIASIRDFRNTQGGDALMAIETDSCPPDAIIREMERADGIKRVTLLKRRGL